MRIYECLLASEDVSSAQIALIVILCATAAAWLLFGVACVFSEIKYRKRRAKREEDAPKEGAPHAEAPEKEPEKRGFARWWANHRPTRRRIIQLYTALLYNANIRGFIDGRIFTGETKNFCVPGLNCYSCPGAVGACPLGALQNAINASAKPADPETGARSTPYYMLGILLLLGLLFGRTICGFLCPVGFGQELLYKIKTPKVKKSRYTRLFSYLKYVILAVFVIAIPVMYGLQLTALPGFCKYICPAGTFGGAIFLLLHPNNAGTFNMLGPIFTWKFCVLIVVCVASVFLFRFFCRFICPLGAIYGFFNKIALLGVKLDRVKCTDCGLCVSHCKMDIKRVGDHECINCGECIDVCPAKAISWKGSKLFLHENAVAAVPAAAAPAEEMRPLAAFTAGAGVAAQAPVSAAPAPAEVRPAKKRRGKRFWLEVGAWCVAAAVFVGAILYYNVYLPKTQDVPPPVGNDVGDACPDFTLETYLGKDPFTLSEHRGEIVLINFWYTDCTPCVAEMPTINRIAEEYGITVVAIHSAQITTMPATKAGVERWLKRYPDALDPSRMWADYAITFAQDTDAGQNVSYTYAMLGGTGPYPMTVIVDREGVIRFNNKGGSVTYDLLTGLLENLNA